VAQVQYALGDVQGSVKHLKESAALRHSVYRRTSVSYDSLLAERQLELGHLEAACATWDGVLDDYPLVQSGRGDEKVRNMKSLLRPHLRNRAARQLYERAQSMNA
jgi:hypothetical protein